MSVLKQLSEEYGEEASEGSVNATRQECDLAADK